MSAVVSAERPRDTGLRDNAARGDATRLRSRPVRRAEQDMASVGKNLSYDARGQRGWDRRGPQTASPQPDLGALGAFGRAFRVARVRARS